MAETPASLQAGPPEASRSARRVAILVERLGTYGGTEGFARRLASALAERGIGVDMICGRQETDPPHGVGVVTVGRPPAFRWLKTAWFAFAAERARRRGGYAVTVSCANTLAQDITRVSGGPLPVFHAKSIRAWPPGLPRLCKRLARALSPANAIVRAIQTRQFAAPGRIVCVSHLVRDWMAASYPALAGREMDVVYNRPDLSRFYPPGAQEREEARRRFGLAPHEFAMSLAGTNFMLKGVGTAIAALPLLPPHVRLLVAGGRKPERFLRAAKDLGVRDRVTFLGRVADMSGLYQASDLFILPTFYDTCANAVLEARACGVPAVSSADNGASHFLPERWVLKDPADHRQLAAIIRGVMSEGDAARSPFAWPEDVEAGVEPFARMVEEILSTGGDGA